MMSGVSLIVVVVVVLIKMGFPCVAQADLALLSSSEPPVWELFMSVLYGILFLSHHLKY